VAVDGTRNVITAAADEGVRRVVFTSSYGAVHMDPDRNPDAVVDETCWSDLGLTISVGKTEISVIFSVFATHRDRNFGPENCIFEFQIQKYKSQILVKQMKFRTVKTKLLTLYPTRATY